MTLAPRSLRCSNPGNLRLSADKWQGLAQDQTDADFFCFQSPKYGFRAMAVTLISYQDRDGIHTLEGAITRWAPVSENDTQAYIAHAEQLTGFSRYSELNLQTYRDLAPVCKAIATHEAGSWVWEDADLDAGLRLAGVESPTPSLSNSRTIQASAIGGGATGLLAAAQAVQAFQPAIDSLQEFFRIAPWIGLVILAVVIAYVVYARIDDHKRAIR